MKIFKFLILIFHFAFIACKKEQSIDVSIEIAAIENGLLPAILVKGDSINQYSLQERMAHYKVPGVSIAVVEHGVVEWAKGYGVANLNNDKKVNTNTIFQAGSISKPLAALAALKLVEEDLIDLDQDVNIYLRTWKVPNNEWTSDEKVTLRRLLTHTAGMTVHGFPGYQQSDTFPSISEVLNGKGNTPAILVDTIPGSSWRYSGGGYTVMEKLIEDVSGIPLDEYLADHILLPIGMQNSTFEQPLGFEYHANASAAYNNEGEIIEGLWHNYPEQAAAGLWTTPVDLAKYCIEIQEIISGKENGVLSKTTVEQMLTKHKNEWGLGPSLLWDSDSLIFKHGGKNAGFTNNMISFVHKGNAVIIMTNADNGWELIEEILRSVSSYYDWGISNPRIVETVELSKEALNQFTGRYKLELLDQQGDDFLIEILLRNNSLMLYDQDNENINVLTPTDNYIFVDLEQGDEIIFQLDPDPNGLLYNGNHQFYKID